MSPARQYIKHIQKLFITAALGAVVPMMPRASATGPETAASCSLETAVQRLNQDFDALLNEPAREVPLASERPRRITPPPVPPQARRAQELRQIHSAFDALLTDTAHIAPDRTPPPIPLEALQPPTVPTVDPLSVTVPRDQAPVPVVNVNGGDLRGYHTPVPHGDPNTPYESGHFDDEGNAPPGVQRAVPLVSLRETPLPTTVRVQDVTGLPTEPVVPALNFTLATPQHYDSMVSGASARIRPETNPLVDLSETTPRPTRDLRRLQEYLEGANELHEMPEIIARLWEALPSEMRVARRDGQIQSVRYLSSGTASHAFLVTFPNGRIAVLKLRRRNPNGLGLSFAAQFLRRDLGMLRLFQWVSRFFQVGEPPRPFLRSARMLSDASHHSRGVIWMEYVASLDPQGRPTSGTSSDALAHALSHLQRNPSDQRARQLLIDNGYVTPLGEPDVLFLRRELQTLEHIYRQTHNLAVDFSNRNGFPPAANAIRGPHGDFQMRDANGGLHPAGQQIGFDYNRGVNVSRVCSRRASSGRCLLWQWVTFDV